jgi:hypothetical protein
MNCRDCTFTYDTADGFDDEGVILCTKHAATDKLIEALEDLAAAHDWIMDSEFSNPHPAATEAAHALLNELKQATK